MSELGPEMLNPAAWTLPKNTEVVRKAVAAAPEPLPPPEKVIVGAVVYPEPAAVTVIEDTTSLDPEPDMLAIAVAPVPRPVMCTVGAAL